MSKHLLPRIDIEIANLREKIASGTATGQREQLQLEALLAKRAHLIEEIAEKPRKELPGISE